MKVLSYHKFYYSFNEYLYSRTYQQFKNDILNSNYDLITIDDGYFSTLKACEILDKYNKQCILFIPTNLIGTDGYLTWKQVKKISEKHIIGNHTHNHYNLLNLTKHEIFHEIYTANKIINNEIGYKPKYFISPWNNYNNDILDIADYFDMTVYQDRISITNMGEV